MSAAKTDDAHLIEIVRQINATHGTALTLVQRFGTGEQGANRLSDQSGAGFVLKWQPGARGLGRLPAVVPALDPLRAAGYPIPRYVAYGVLKAPRGRYSVQEMLPGQPFWGAGEAIIAQVLVLNDLQAGRATHLLARPGSPHTGSGSTGTRVRTVFPLWQDLVPRLTLRGGSGYCQLTAMRCYSPATAALLTCVQEYVRTHAGRLADAPSGDAVHGDFSGPNILVDGGRISGVVDWEGLTPGDRAFDLATLLFYEGYYANVPATRQRLWAHALELADATTLGLYLCHMVHRQTDWSVRHHGTDEVAQVLGICAAVLDDLAERTGHPIRFRT